MASLRRHKETKFWFACFTGPDGRRYQKSTRETDKRRAQKIADQYEGVSTIGRQGLLTELHARKVLGEIFQIANRQTLQLDTVGDYFRRWLKSKEARMKPKAFDRYAQLLADFLKWARQLQNFGLQHLSSVHLARFRDDYLQEKSAATVNTALSVIQTALEDACNDHLIDVNEATRVQRLEENKQQNRRPFTREELGRILAACDPEWKGMILTGLYVGGVRIGDGSDLRCENIDLTAKPIRAQSQKTGK